MCKTKVDSIFHYYGKYDTIHKELVYCIEMKIDDIIKLCCYKNREEYREDMWVKFRTHVEFDGINYRDNLFFHSEEYIKKAIEYLESRRLINFLMEVD